MFSFVFTVTSVEIERIPKRPLNECPKGSFDGLVTCYCEDHCSWTACRLLKPPSNCLSNIGKKIVWAWDAKENFWVAQGMNYNT